MNRFKQRLALYLIDRRLRKMVQKAAKTLTQADHKEQRTTTIHDVLDNHAEFIRLRHLRENIESINNPWQGLFNPYWTVWPKDPSKVEPFEEIDTYPLIPTIYTDPEELNEVDAEWARLSLDEYIERLNAETHSQLQINGIAITGVLESNKIKISGQSLEEIAGMGRLREEQGEPYNPVHVYRQFMPKDDAIEYTMYFHKDGIKYRLDHTVPIRDLESMSPDRVENEIKNILWAKIDRGEYKEVNKKID